MTEFKFNPVKIKEKVQKNEIFLHVNSHFFTYKKNGVFEICSESKIYRMVSDILKDKYRERYGKEVKHCLMVDCAVESDSINKNKDLINLKNGMFCLKNMVIFPHSHEHLSTVQLPISFNQEAVCPLWEKTIDEIFMGKQWKINILQEYFGYCLTTDTTQQKALMNIGSGANGKSLIFKVLETIMGKQNISAVPIARLDDRHYLAELYGKLVNLSLESEANIEINEANFKNIVSGDPITVDEKYGKPFSFNPFCKLIFSMNSLPYVGDKTMAFYRRVLILTYEREFINGDDNKNLYNELIKEMDGIFLWMLEGLKRLRANGSFTNDQEMVDLINEYKRDNNPVLTFIEENIVKDSNGHLTKTEIYQRYTAWSKNNGYKSSSSKTLTKSIKKYFTNGVTEERDGSKRFWKGIVWENMWEN